MSLLLDALKKAADDKQKASHNKPAVKAVNTGKPVVDTAEELTLQPADDIQSQAETAIDGKKAGQVTLDSALAENQETEVELTLDDVAVTDDNSASQSFVEDNGQEASQQQKHKGSASAADGFTVSDDALSMLINKTNRDVKRGTRTLYISVFLISLAVLAAGGVYSYLDMQAEMAGLERKHQIAMQSMRLKTSNDKPAEKSDVIRKLVSDANLNEKVQSVKQPAATKAAPKQRQPVARVNKKSSKSGQVKAGQEKTVKATAVSIQKSKKFDPIGEKLEAAWLAYENGQYNKAKSLYQDVVSNENNNRDALLGLGAIAVVENNKAKAREVYLSLLNLDPRDPIASAALASLHSDAASLKSDEEYLLNLLQKNPQAVHLNFALGNTYAQQNKWKLAQQYYFNAWQGDPENADYIFNLAVSMDQLNKKQQAVDFYQDSLTRSVNKQVSFSREAVQQRIKELSEL